MIATAIKKGDGYITRPWYEDENYSLKWFLPGIRQMEDALMQQYSRYREFQEFLYWSASAGAKNSWGSLTQDDTHARATGVDSNGDYFESNGSMDNARGYLLRTEICRKTAILSSFCRGPARVLFSSVCKPGVSVCLFCWTSPEGKIFS